VDSSRGSGSHHPSWSAAGRLIVFMSNRGPLIEGASLYTVTPNGTGLRRLTRARFEDVDPAWLRLAE
jgi:Tol biopolymer transport system component